MSFLSQPVIHQFWQCTCSSTFAVFLLIALHLPKFRCFLLLTNGVKGVAADVANGNAPSSAYLAAIDEFFATIAR